MTEPWRGECRLPLNKSTCLACWVTPRPIPGYSSGFLPPNLLTFAWRSTWDISAEVFSMSNLLHGDRSWKHDVHSSTSHMMMTLSDWAMLCSEYTASSDETRQFCCISGTTTPTRQPPWAWPCLAKFTNHAADWSVDSAVSTMALQLIRSHAIQCVSNYFFVFLIFQTVRKLIFFPVGTNRRNTVL